MSFSTRSIPRLLVMALLCAAVAGGCGGDSKKPSVVPSGFLGDYSQLAPGREGQARLIYINPEADFSLYDKMMIQPVALWDPERSARLSIVGPPSFECASSLSETSTRHRRRPIRPPVLDGATHYLRTTPYDAPTC